MTRLPALRRNRRPLRPQARRGVASVLAMMFLVIFSSLTAAMAVVAQSNLRTAESGEKMSRAMSAAETGLVFASRRLSQDARRFVVEKGVVDLDFAEDIWLGTVNQGADGPVTVLDPPDYTESSSPSGIAEAVRNAHENNAHNISASGAPDSPSVDAFGTVRVPAIALSNEVNGPYFILTYELLNSVGEDDPHIRVTSEGVDGDVHRTLQMDFHIDKKIEFAVLSPNRIMIGKNVRVEGPVGSRFGVFPGTNDPNPSELNSANADPLVMRSDFYFLAPGLDAKLDTLFQQVVAFDVDGDGRLRPDHPTEGNGVTASEDYDGDEYVDDFDLFLSHFDINGDGRVCYDSSLANDAGLGAIPEEFADIDDQMCRLIDEAYPDRDGDGETTQSDRTLGYRDGVIDIKDAYAKVAGRLAFSIVRDDWEAYHAESYQTVNEGPVRHGLDIAPASFEVTDDEMREVTTDMFSDSRTWFEDEATGNFADQVLGGSGTTTLPPPDPAPRERVPFGAPGFYDYYKRTIYTGYTFDNVRILKGNNGLFVDCLFKGVTYIETNEDCDHENWNACGAVQEVPSNSGFYVEKYPGLQSESGGTPVLDTRIESNSIRFDNCTFLGSVAGDRPNEYTHWRNKLQFTGETRFYIDPDDPELASDPHPDAPAWKTTLENMSAADRAEMEKSSILMPGWSVDVGNFTNEQGATPADTAKVKLKGTIIAGILDVRGTADVHGTLLMTFRPAEGQGPLFYGGLPDAFNTTIGYFGPQDGDGEGSDPAGAAFTGFGEITLRYDPEAKLPDGIPWPLRIDADTDTYVE